MLKFSSLSSIALILMASEATSQTKSTHPLKQEAIPIVKENKTIFIDTQLKEKGDGSFTHPFNRFEDAVSLIKSQQQESVVFISGHPTEGFNFGKLKVFGPKAALVISKAAKEGEKLKVLPARKTEDIKINKIYSKDVILGFSSQVDKIKEQTSNNTQALKPVLLDDGNNQLEIGLSARDIENLERNNKLPLKVIKNSGQIILKIPSPQPSRVASAPSLPPIFRPIPVGPAPMPVPGGGGGIAPPPAPAGGVGAPPPPPPPPAPAGGGAPPPPPPPAAGGGPPPPPPPPGAGGPGAFSLVEAAINRCMSTLGFAKFEEATLEALLRKVDVTTKEPAEFKGVLIASLLRGLETWLNRGGYSGNKDIAEVIKNFCNRITSQINSLPVEEVRNRLHQAQSAMVGGTNIVAPLSVVPPYSELHKIFGFPRPAGGAHGGPAIPPGGAKPLLVKLTPEAIDVQNQFPADLQALITSFYGKNADKTYELEAGGKAKYPLAIREFQKATGGAKKAPNDDWKNAYIQAYQKGIFGLQITTAIADTLVKIFLELDRQRLADHLLLDRYIDIIDKSIITLYNSHISLHPGPGITLVPLGGPVPAAMPHGLPAFDAKMQTQYDTYIKQKTSYVAQKAAKETAFLNQTRKLSNIWVSKPILQITADFNRDMKNNNYTKEVIAKYLREPIVDGGGKEYVEYVSINLGK